MDNSVKASVKLRAGRCLRILIEENYRTQQEFADDHHYELRTVNRWINDGVGFVDTIQELAGHFGLDFFEFFDASP